MELLGMHGLSPQQRSSRIFKFINAPPGDMSPSLIWRTLKYYSHNLIMEITLQCFPKPIRDRMPDYETMDEKDFLLEADKIAKASISRNNNQAAATKADTDDSSRRRRGQRTLTEEPTHQTKEYGQLHT